MNLGGSAKLTGPFEAELAYYVYRKDALGDIGTRLAQQMSRQYGGVRVYRDGLRVLPYGEPENDWLGLDLEYRRRTTLVPIGNINVFGQVLVSRAENPELEDTASREGFIANDAYNDLRTVLRDALVRTAVVVGGARARKTRAAEMRQPLASRSALLQKLIRDITRALQSELPPDRV